MVQDRLRRTGNPSLRMCATLEPGMQAKINMGPKSLSPKHPPLCLTSPGHKHQSTGCEIQAVASLQSGRPSRDSGPSIWGSGFARMYGAEFWGRTKHPPCKLRSTQVKNFYEVLSECEFMTCPETQTCFCPVSLQPIMLLITPKGIPTTASTYEIM